MRKFITLFGVLAFSGTLKASTFDAYLIAHGTGFYHYESASYGSLYGVSDSPIIYYPAFSQAYAQYHDSLIIFSSTVSAGILNLSYQAQNTPGPSGGGSGGITATGVNQFGHGYYSGVFNVSIPFSYNSPFSLDATVDAGGSNTSLQLNTLSVQGASSIVYTDASDFNYGRKFLGGTFVETVPEPSTWILALSGALASLVTRYFSLRRRRRSLDNQFA